MCIQATPAIPIARLAQQQRHLAADELHHRRHQAPSSSGQDVPASSGPMMAITLREEMRITPRLLECAKILSGRSLLAIPDLTRFGSPIINCHALLTELVCENDQVAVSLNPRSLTPALATLVQAAILTDHDDNPHALIRAHSTTGRLRFQLYSPSHVTAPPPPLVAAQYFAGPMAAANITRMIAVVPRTSSLDRLHTSNHHAQSSTDIPPPSPLRGGRGEGPAFVRARVFQHELGVSAPT